MDDEQRREVNRKIRDLTLDLEECDVFQELVSLLTGTIEDDAETHGVTWGGAGAPFNITVHVERA